MIEVECRTRAEFDGAMARRDLERAYLFEQFLARRMRFRRRLALPGFCEVCETPATFMTNLRHAAARERGVLQPSRRDRQTCRGCRLIARQRYLLARMRRMAASRSGRTPSIYITEQVSGFAERCVAEFGDGAVRTSEYLGEDVDPGAIRDGVRHEDLTALSFAPASFDLIASADVLEHVADLEAAMRSLFRVLRSGGTVMLMFPFFSASDATVARARRVGGAVELLAEPEHHHDPLHRGGSLVFHHIGWDVLHMLRDAGFVDPRVVLYWSHLLGYLGLPSTMIEADKPGHDVA